jgi:hypothetical protein
MSHQGRTPKSRQGIGGPATIEGRKNQIASRLAYNLSLPWIAADSRLASPATLNGQLNPFEAEALPKKPPPIKQHF